MKFFRALRSVLRILGILAPGLDAIREQFPKLDARLDAWGDRLEKQRDELVAKLAEKLGKPLREVADELDQVLDSPALPADLRVRLQRVRDVIGLLLQQAG